VPTASGLAKTIQSSLIHVPDIHLGRRRRRTEKKPRRPSNREQTGRRRVRAVVHQRMRQKCPIVINTPQPIVLPRAPVKMAEENPRWLRLRRSCTRDFTYHLEWRQGVRFGVRHQLIITVRTWGPAQRTGVEQTQSWKGAFTRFNLSTSQ
jgi:hypothetical protein